MDPLVPRVVRAYKLAATSVPDRIRAIPGYERSNFLQSILQQAERGRTLSPKQLAVLDDIERKSGGPRHAPEPTVPSRPTPGALVLPRSYGSKVLDMLADAFRKNQVVQVSDPGGLLANGALYSAIVRELRMDFDSMRERADEYLADEDDAHARAKLRAESDAASDASDAMARAKIDAKGQGGSLTLTMSVSYPALVRKIRLRPRGSIGVGGRLLPGIRRVRLLPGAPLSARR